MSITNLQLHLHIRDIQIYGTHAYGLRGMIEYTLAAFYKAEGTLKCSLGR